MSGGFALVREFVLVYMAANGKPVAPNGVLAIFGHVAVATFIISGLVVLYQLHSENAKLQEARARPLSSPLPTAPLPGASSASVQAITPIADQSKAYVKERKISEVTDRLITARWNERQAIAKASYIGFWVRWKGKVSSVLPHGENAERGFTVAIWNDNSLQPFANLRFPPSERHAVLQLEPGQMIEFEGRIVEASNLELYIEDITITHIAPSA